MAGFGGVLLGGIAQGVEAGQKQDLAKAELGIRNRLADIQQQEVDQKGKANQQALFKDMLDRSATALNDATALWEKLVSAAPDKSAPQLLQAGQIIRGQIEATGTGLSQIPGGMNVAQSALKKFDAITAGLPSAVEAANTKGLAAGVEATAAQPGKTAAEVANINATAQPKAAAAGMQTAATTGAEIATKGAMADTMATTAGKVKSAESTAEQAAKGPQNTVQNEAKLRDDFNNSPVVKNYREALTAYNSIVDASARKTRAADLNMVYGIAKLFDPGSVVREGEQVVVRDTAGLSQNVLGAIQSLNGGAALTDKTRAALVAEAHGRIDQHQAAYDAFKQQMTDVATRSGADPRNVVIDVNRNVGAGAGQATAPVTAVNPKTGERIQSLDGGKTWAPVR